MSGEFLRFQICGSAIEARADDPELIDILRQTYPSYLEHGAPSRLEPRERIWFRRRDAAFEVGSDGSGGRQICETLDDAIDTVEFVLTEAFLRSCSDMVHVHASGAVVRGCGILVLGPSGAGKSSLGVFWSVNGMRVLGDDVVFVDDGGLAVPFKRQFKTDPEVLRTAGIDARDTPFWFPDGDDAWFDPQAMGAGWASPAPVHLVVVSRFSPGAEFAVESVSRPEGLNALLHSQLPTGVGSPRSFNRLVDLVGGAQLVEVRFGSPETAAARLAELIP